MKKIFKNLILCTTVCGCIVPIVGCNDQTTEEEKPKATTIEIVSSFKDLTLTQDEIFITKTLEAKCFDQKGKEMEMNIDFYLLTSQGAHPPSWIYLTENNQIKIIEGKTKGNYAFNLYAYNSETELCSKPLTFNIKVVSNKPIIPDSIEIQMEDVKYCMYGEESKMPIAIDPIKPGYDKKQLMRNCNFSINVTSGKDTDLDGNKLFKISEPNINTNLVISKATDETYKGTYKLIINAILIDAPTVKTSKEITIHFGNVNYHYDENKKFLYYRETENDNWALIWAPSETKAINGVLDEIEGKPVTTITSNFCSKSNITHLVEIELPKSITNIENNAFANQSYLCLCSMPGVTNVGSYAFFNDSMMEYNVHKDQPSFKKVEQSGFENCCKIDFKLEQNIDSIGDCAFKNTGLSQFNCDTNLEFIGQEAFADCQRLSSFTVKAPTPPILGGATFSRSSNLQKFFVKSEYVDVYKTNQYWSIYKDKIEGI